MKYIAKDEKITKSKENTTSQKKPRIIIDQVEANALHTIIESHKSNWHYKECQLWKFCDKSIKAPPKEKGKKQEICFCEDFKPKYPNTDIVIDNVSSLLKKLERVVK